MAFCVLTYTIRQANAVNASNLMILAKPMGMKNFRQNLFGIQAIAIVIFFWLILITPTRSNGQTGIDTSTFHSSIAQFDLANSIVMIGEAHEVAGTYGLEKFIIEELSRKGFTNLILEAGNSEAEIYNMYMRTGNEELLNYTRARHSNYRAFITSLRKVNPELHFEGVDFERGVCLQLVFDSLFAQVKEASLLEYLRPLKSITGKTAAGKIKHLILSAAAEYGRYETLLKKELGEKETVFRKIIFNPVFQADFGLSSVNRDRAIFKSLSAMSDTLLRHSILIFGSNHFTNKDHFGELLSNNNSTGVNLVWILFGYTDCTNFLRKGLYSSGEPLLGTIEHLSKAKPSVGFYLLEEHENIRQKKWILAHLVHQ